MALFSTTAATANISLLRKVKYEPFKGGFEFKTYQHYKDVFSSNAIQPESKWKGQDGAWLRADRLNARGTWVRAAHVITSQKLSNRLQPFGQIDDYYKLIHVWVVGRKHEIRWLHGAHYLVEDLWEGFEDDFQGALIVNPSPQLIMLLSELNKNIVNFAIEQFSKLLYGEYAKSPRTGVDAYLFDRDFIIKEQEEVALSVYSRFKGDPSLVHALAEARSLSDLIFAKN